MLNRWNTRKCIQIIKNPEYENHVRVMNIGKLR